MSRRLPEKRSENQNLIIKAVEDFLGFPTPKQELKQRIVRISLYLMGRKKRNPLTEEDKEAIWFIRQNLQDKTYKDSLAKALN